jgi:hypothetical protein
LHDAALNWEGNYHGAAYHGQEEWVAGPYHTNNAEACYSVFKRGIKGRLSALPRKAPSPLCGGIWFPLSNRAARGVDDITPTNRGLLDIEGKRLTNRRTRVARPEAAG